MRQLREGPAAKQTIAGARGLALEGFFLHRLLEARRMAGKPGAV